jgi:ribosomal protein S18 acetylase RimI-like enzyme
VSDTPLVVRRIRAEEWPRWRDVRLRMLREEAAFFGTRWEDASRDPDERWRAWVEEAAEGTTRVVFVAEQGDRWVGVVGAFPRIDPAETQLISMWVDPRVRGRGVAEQLIRAVAEWARARGSAAVFLFVQETNVRAQHLYERVGFHPTGERERVPRRRGFKLLYTAAVDDLLDGGG